MIKLYECQIEERGCSCNIGITYDLKDASQIALNYFRHLTYNEKSHCDLWVNEYDVEEELVGTDADETFQKMVDKDWEDSPCIRNPHYTYKLNRVKYKRYNSNVVISDDFGNNFTLMITPDELPDTVEDAIDYLYDEVGDHLVVDKEWVRDMFDLIVLEGIIEDRVFKAFLEEESGD